MDPFAEIGIVLLINVIFVPKITVYCQVIPHTICSKMTFILRPLPCKLLRQCDIIYYVGVYVAIVR